MTAQVDIRGSTNIATDKTFHNLSRVASKKISNLRRRISARDSSSNNKPQRTNDNFVQENSYIAEQGT
ncbi:9784_t:CDS:1, partial [Scutellospora calospora]